MFKVLVARDRKCQGGVSTGVSYTVHPIVLFGSSSRSDCALSLASAIIYGSF